MSNNHIDNISIRDAKIMFRNFSGKPDKFNPQGGRRIFSVRLTNELADNLKADGWNIKYLKPREDDEEPKPFIQVRINYGEISPKIYLVTKKHKTLLDEESVGTLDNEEIANVDIVIRPYCWNVNEKTGITAYVKNMYVTIVEDEFAEKYDKPEEEEIPFK